MTGRWTRVGPDWVATAGDAEQMRELGADLAAVLRAGDLVILDGPLGAGKTTLTQGLGAALQVRGAVTSPTFVIAREHRGPGLGLLHVDAYRLADAAELADLDLDAEVSRSVMVVEWGAGKADDLAPSRLLVRIERGDPADQGAGDDPAAGERLVRVTAFGSRWDGLALPGVAEDAGQSAPEG